MHTSVFQYLKVTATRISQPPFLEYGINFILTKLEQTAANILK